MHKKIGFITLLSILATVLTAAAVSAQNAPTASSLATAPTTITKDYRQDDWEFDEDSFVDEDGVTWYLHPDGWYYDFKPGEEPDYFDDSFYDEGDFGDFGDFDDEDPGDYGDDQDYDPFEGMSDEEIAAREESTTGKTPAKPGSHPWQVALVDSRESNAYNGQFCGGSLIAPQWVLTAAHCLEGTSASEVDIVIGRDTLSSNAGERIPVAKIISHEDYLSGKDENADIALIKLSRPAKQGEVVALANNHATGHLDDAGVDVTASGWGLLQEMANTSPDKLHEVSTEIVSPEQCKVAYGNDINNSVICAGEPEGGKDSCNGDSGGPLVTKESGKPVQVGVVSWGDGCGLAGSYGVYTKVAAFQNWLTTNMNS